MMFYLKLLSHSAPCCAAWCCQCTVVDTEGRRMKSRKFSSFRSGFRDSDC